MAPPVITTFSALIPQRIAEKQSSGFPSHEPRLYSSFSSYDSITPGSIGNLSLSVNADNTYSFENVNIQVAEPKAEGTTYSFVGSYKSYNLVNDDYMLYADKWWKTETGDTYTIKAFRAYIKANTPAAAKQLNLVIDGQTTGLKLNTVNGNIEGETYNIAGQRVANSYKGLIIKNGKKIIKK